MSVLNMTVKVGHMLQIGDGPDNGAIIKVEDRSGRAVRLTVASALSPIRLLGPGLIPERWTCGITGERRRVLQAIETPRAVA